MYAEKKESVRFINYCTNLKRTLRVLHGADTDSLGGREGRDRGEVGTGFPAIMSCTIARGLRKMLKTI